MNEKLNEIYNESFIMIDVSHLDINPIRKNSEYD